jgi:hypothetical protein
VFLSPEVRKFLGRLSPKHRAEIEAVLDIDVVTLLASLDDEALAAKIKATREHVDMIFAAFGQALDGLEAKIERDVADAVIRTATSPECVRELAKLCGVPDGVSA